MVLACHHCDLKPLVVAQQSHTWDGLLVRAMPASIWAHRHLGTQKVRQVYWPVAGPVTRGSGRETGVEVASLTDRGVLRRGGTMVAN